MVEQKETELRGQGYERTQQTQQSQQRSHSSRTEHRTVNGKTTSTHQSWSSEWTSDEDVQPPKKTERGRVRTRRQQDYSGESYEDEYR